MSETTLRIERVIDATPERVFAAWTNADAMAMWYQDGPGWVVRVVELDVRVGGTYRVEFGPADEAPFVESGEYLEIVPAARLVMAESLTRAGETMWAATRVTVELHAEDGKTRCVLVHEGFPDRQRRIDASGGWPGFLDRIERYVSAG
jgi:uncharacterized protein YndB with AHSA1/START domain